MTLLTSQLAPMQFLKARIVEERDLEHERSEGSGTDKAETSLDGGSSASGLGQAGASGGAVTGTGGRGAQGRRNGQRAGGLDDSGVVAGGTGAGDVSAGGSDGLDGGGVGGHRGGLDDRRRSDGVTSRGRRGDGVTGRGGGLASGGGAGSGSDSRAGSSGSRAGRDNDGAVFLGDTELGGVLVLAGNVVNQLESVAGYISLEGGGRSPGEGTRVVDALSKSLNGNNVGGGATEQEERDRVGGGRLPGDGEGLASRDNLRRVSGWNEVSIAIL